MKTKTFILVALMVMQAVVCNAGTSAVDMQGAMITSAPAENLSVDANVEIDVTLPSFPGIDPITFIGDIKVPFAKGDHNIMVMADQLPQLFAALSGIPESFGPVTLGMKVASSAVKISWDDEKNVKISAVDFKVTAYKASESNVSESSEKMAEFTLKDVILEVNDIQDGTAYLSFSSTLPKCANETFDQILSGKEITGEITVGF